MKHWLNRFQFYLDERARFPPSNIGRKYDYGAVGDYSFSWPLANYVITQSRESIRQVCEQTNYGPYSGGVRLNSVGSTYSRMLRAYYLNDGDWLQEELDSFRTVSIGQDVQHDVFAAPKKYWEVFRYLFEDRRDEFLASIREFDRWYVKRVKTHMMADDNGYFYPACINMVLLSAIKIAVADKKWEINYEAQFLPMDIVNIE